MAGWSLLTDHGPQNLQGPAGTKGPGQRFTITPTSPYRRQIDLERFMKFDEPGLYRCRLRYGEFPRSDSPHDHWTGELVGDVFVVEVKARAAAGG